MRRMRFLLVSLLATQMFGVVQAQQPDKGQAADTCTEVLDLAKYAGLADDILLQDDVEFGIAAPLMSTAPTADGVLSDGEYAGANRCYFTYAENENPGHSWPNLDNLDDGDPDLTSYMYFGHTATDLYVTFEVYDDFLDHDFPANSFQNDGVEIFINPDLDTADAWGAGKFQIYVDAAGDGDIEFNNRGSTAGISAAPEDDPLPGEFWSAGLPFEDGSGYVVEIRIPLESLDTAGGDEDDPVPPQIGDYVLINTAIDDNDEDDNLGGQTGHHILWHHDGAGSPFGGGEVIWTVPLEFTEAISVGPTCDLDGNGECNAADIDALTAAITGGENSSKFDINGDGSVNNADRTQLIEVEFNTYFGDSNLDLQFSSSDFVSVFSAAKYETGQSAGWAEGDWNGDGQFNSTDFVVAFSSNAYEKGPRPAAAAVPEPSSIVLIVLAIGGLALGRRR
ncbi:MAG: PEP-CTERM sorting domain-containing protein [Planctomycetales bacterium]|nr:PEP-CTERM sorting domain-containing protein [Planctomycetales bacterium]